MSAWAGVPNVLLLGEANFAFAAALASLLAALRSPGGASLADVADAYLRLGLADCRVVHLVASGIEAREEVLQKYPEASGILDRLQTLPRSLVEVGHGVNAMDLSASFGEGELWAAIAWNHPHLGTEDLRLHSALLAHFFAAAVVALRPGGRVVLSLVEGQEARWGLEAQAARHGLLVVAAAPFEASRFPGYECKRNATGKSFKSLSAQRQQAGVMRSWTYHLRRRAENPEVEPMPAGAPLAARGGQRKGPNGDADPTSSRPAVPGLVCDVCGRSFSSAQGLRTHVRQVHELNKYGKAPGEGAGLCSECGRSFGSEEALRQHVAAAHPGPRPPRGPPERLDAGRGAGGGGAGGGEVECAVCGLPVPRGTDERSHLQALLPITEKSLRCACGRAFGNPRALEQHGRSCPEARAALEAPLLGPGAASARSSAPASCWIGFATCVGGCCGTTSDAR